MSEPQSSTPDLLHPRIKHHDESPCSASMADALRGLVTDLEALRTQIKVHQDRTIVATSPRLYDLLESQNMELRATLRDLQEHLGRMDMSMSRSMQAWIVVNPSLQEEDTHNDVVRDLMRIYETVRRRLRCSLQLAEQEQDMLTAAIVQERLEEHDFSAYMIEQMLQEEPMLPS